jgi:hypothetical protein
MIKKIVLGAAISAWAVLAQSGATAFAGNAQYSCANNGDLDVSVYGDSGNDRLHVTILNFSFCNMQAENLNFLRSDVYNDVTVGVCNYQLDLLTFVISAQGYIGQVNTRRIGNDQICLREASYINQANDGGNNNSRRANLEFRCDGAGSMQFTVQPLNDSNYGRATVQILNYDFCQLQARDMSASIGQIHRARNIAICDWQLNLVRFKVSPNGLIDNLGTTLIGNSQRCLSRANAINDSGGNY